MNHSRLLAALAAFLLPLSACDKLTDSNQPAPGKPSVSFSLTDTVISSTDTADHTLVLILAKAPAQGMKVTASILDATGNVVTSQFATSFGTLPCCSDIDSVLLDSGWKIAAKPTTAAGTYTFKVTVTDKNKETASQSATFRVTADATDPDPYDPGTESILISGWAGLGTVTPDEFSTLSGSLFFESSYVYLTVTVETPFGVDVSSVFDLSYPLQTAVSPFNLSKVMVKSLGAPSGSYNLVFTVRDSQGNELTQESSFSVVNGAEDADFVFEGPYILGAQGSTEPSYLQIGGSNPATWTKSQSATHAADIDLIFGTSPSGAPMLASPTEADRIGLNLSSWATLRSTELVDFGIEAPVSRTEVEVALDEARMGINPNSVIVESGHYYIAALSNGSLAVIHVTGITGSGSKTEVELSLLY